MNIKSQPDIDRPREKMLAKGAAALSEAELLAILIGSGTREESAVELMQRLLHDCGDSLHKLGRMSFQELTDGRYKGIGEAKAITIIAATELARRRSMEQADDKIMMVSATDVYRYMRPRIGELQHEEFHLLPLQADGSLRDNDTVLIGKGGIDSVNVDVRLILREALLRQAPAIIVCHNHPSGNLKPSRYDNMMTDKLNTACNQMDIRLRDHVIVASDDYYSYSENGRL